MDTELAFSAASRAFKASSGSVDTVGLSPAEAARRLGVSRSRIYALVEQGELDDVGHRDSLRISLTSLERRLAAAAPVGQPLSSTNAWAVLALGSHDAAFRDHVAARLSDPDRSRAKTRLSQHSLVELVPRLRGRSVIRRFAIGAQALVEVLGDARLVLAGPSAARSLGWPLPDGGSFPVEAYVPEAALVDVVDRYQLEPDPDGDLVLRSVPEPWPFPPHVRVAPELVAVVDLVDGLTLELAELGRSRLLDLTSAASEPSWQHRPQRRRPVRPLIPSGPAAPPAPRHLQVVSIDAVWDDRAERDARGLVALLFVAGGKLRRAELAEALHCSLARLTRACDLLRASPPSGLALLEHADHLQLVTAPDCGKLVEDFLHVAPEEALSQAALEVLAIVAYEQPLSRSDIGHIRGTDSSGVIDNLLARGLIIDDARYGGRGRPAFLVTTDRFLQMMGIGSLAELPARPATDSIASRG